jgi:CRP-like cAMP-binding protein
VISGAVRTYKILRDGRRQVGGFYLPGDIFGLEFADEHTLSAEAIADANVLVIKRSMLTALANHDAGVARELFALAGHEVQRMRERVLMLIKTAQERVVDFLLEMAERVPAGNAVELAMSRQDIADYLGLTIETVSRTLSSLEDSAAIELPTSRRRIVLRNRTALSHMNS